MSLSWFTWLPCTVAVIVVVRVASTAAVIVVVRVAATADVIVVVRVAATVAVIVVVRVAATIAVIVLVHVDHNTSNVHASCARINVIYSPEKNHVIGNNMHAPVVKYSAEYIANEMNMENVFHSYKFCVL